MKGNQKDLMDDLSTYFDLEIEQESLDIAVEEMDFEKNHGKIEKREYYLSYDVSCIYDKSKWKMVKAVGRVDVSMGKKLTLKQKMTRYISDFKNIENLIFNVIPCL